MTKAVMFHQTRYQVRSHGRDFVTGTGPSEFIMVWRGKKQFLGKQPFVPPLPRGDSLRRKPAPICHVDDGGLVGGAILETDLVPHFPSETARAVLQRRKLVVITGAILPPEDRGRGLESNS